MFVAVELPAAAVTALATAITPLRERHSDLRWVRPSRWHLTLAFLGELSIAARMRAQHALQRATAHTPPLEVTLPGRVGRFGNRVLWAAVDTGEDDVLASLVAALRRELSVAGVPYDGRPFRAHVTLARNGGQRRLPRPGLLTAPGLPCTCPVTRVALMASDPGGGNGYRTLATWPLRGGAHGA